MSQTLAKPVLNKVGYLIVYVDDMHMAVSFYKEKLGLAPKFEDKEWTELETQGFTLALHASKKAPAIHKENGPCIVFSVEDIKGTHAALKEQGLAVSELKTVCEHDGMIGLSGDFADPSGNRLSVYGMVKKTV